jgi:vacuolar-type H+-ATPase subunit E/Vma4
VQVADLLTAQQRALDPLREALVEAARAEATRLTRSAAEEGRAAVANAREQAAQVLAVAATEGEAEGRELAALATARAEQRARTALLEARHAAYAQLVDACERAVAAALREPDQRSALHRALRARLGADVTVRDTADGGLRAEAPDGRAVDASVAALVARALEGLDLEGLWSGG